MICLTLAGLDCNGIQETIDALRPEMVEVRLDSCTLTPEQTEELFSQSEIPLVATCRTGAGCDAKTAQERLTTAIRSGARFADLEVDAPAAMSRYIQKLCRDNGVELIRSYHNLSCTPDPEYLAQVLDRCYRYGADVAKVVTAPGTPEEAASVMALYQRAPQGRLIAFCAGEQWRDTRLKSLALGAPFSYAAPDGKSPAAPGQWALGEFEAEVYRGLKPYLRRGLRMPASKSFAQRCIIAAALADGVSHFGNFSECGDTLAAVEAARTLGASVEIQGSTLTVTGIGARPGSLDLKKINAGESGLLSRLLIPLMAVLGKGDFLVEGCRTLLQRPLSGAADIMAAFGVMISNENSDWGRTVHIPARVRGNLIPGVADISGAGGSQLISGLLMSLPLCTKPSTIFVSDPKSLPYMFITIDLLKRFGIRIESEMEGDARMLEQQDWSACSGVTFRLKGGQRYQPVDLDFESDWSAAANYLVAGAVFGLAEIDNLDCGSIQADISIMDLLVESGASLSQTEDGRVCVTKAPLEGFCADLSNAPDLFPAASVLACFCSGESRLSGVGRLRAKESDRASAIMDMLSALGVEAAIEEDEMVIQGQTLASRVLNGRLLRPGRFSTRHDHRMAMALKVAALGASGPVELDDEECLGKSFPGFKI